MKVLVTGSSGYIGRALCSLLANDGHEVAGLDLQPGPPGAFLADVADLAQVHAAMSRFRPQTVVHLAAVASVPECEAKPQRCIESNVLGTMHVARSAAEVGARVVFASSAAVYGGLQTDPSRVTQPLCPTNAYGASKVVGEKLVAGICRDYAILRFFNVYGGPCARSYVIPDVVRKIRSANGEVRLWGSGQEARDFVHLSDVISALRLALTGPATGVYNVASGRATEIRHLVQRIAALMDRSGLSFRFEGKRPGDFDRNYGSILKDDVLPSWAPHVALDEGLRESIRSVPPSA
jgi:UDP-glucose 4-epimerase